MNSTMKGDLAMQLYELYINYWEKILIGTTPENLAASAEDDDDD